MSDMSPEKIVAAATIATALGGTPDANAVPIQDAGNKPQNPVVAENPGYFENMPKLVPSAEAGEWKTRAIIPLVGKKDIYDTVGPYEKLRLATNPPTDWETGTNGGASCLVEARRFLDSSVKAIFDDATQNTMANVITSNARDDSNGQVKYTKIELTIGLTSNEFDPEIASLITQEVDINTAPLGQPGNPKSIGNFGVTAKDGHVYLLYVPVDFNDPSAGINLNDPLIAGRLNKAVSQTFFSAAASHGTSLNPSILTGNLGYQNLIQQQAVKIVSS